MQSICMSAKKKTEATPPATPKADRHKPGRHVRIIARYADQLDKLAERNATSVPIEVNRLIRESLEKIGLWPPPDDEAS